MALITHTMSCNSDIVKYMCIYIAESLKQNKKDKLIFQIIIATAAPTYNTSLIHF